MTLRDATRDLARRAGAARASAQVLLGDRMETDWAVRSAPWAKPFGDLLHALRSAQDELEALAKRPTLARRLYTALDGHPDSLDWLNRADANTPPDWTLANVIEAAAWDGLRTAITRPKDDAAIATDPRVGHILNHAQYLCEDALAVLAAYLDILRTASADQGHDGLPRAVRGSLDAQPSAKAFAFKKSKLSAADIARLRGAVAHHDLFSFSRTYRATMDGVLPGPVGAIRAIEKFYGYQKERDTIAGFFESFASGHRVQPLLVSGMPGMGKTHLTIASVLARPELILITAEARHLEAPLEHLMTLLASHPHRKFVVFFDDIDPELVEWSTFRNQIEGYLPAPDSVATVIATNGDFSARIRSRCATCAFRPMNPEVCQEFVSDYLGEHRWMSQPYPNLVSTVAADYVAHYKRGLYTELSPRSLIRYFESLEDDKDRVRRLIRESLEDVVQVPAEEPFIQSNRQILERLRREKGGALGLAPAAQEPPIRPFFENRTPDGGHDPQS